MTIIGYDTFIRANTTNGWKSATDSQTWNVARGANSSYAVVSDEGTIAGTTAETAAFLGNKTTANFSEMVRMSRASSTSSSTGVLARASVTTVQGSNVITGYKARLKSGNLDVIREVAGTSTVIATTPYVVTPGLYDDIHFQVIGSSLWANAWPDGTDEPSDWMIGPITDTTIGGTGQFGLSATLQPGDTALFDSFSCDNVQPLNPPLADTPYGYTVENKSPIPQDTLQDIVNEGFTWIRPQTNGQLMEKTDDGSRGSTLSSVIDWTLMDDIVLRGNSLGLNICLPVQNPPNWHCTAVTSPANPNNPIEVPNLLDTVAFATAVITRYNGRTINPKTGNPYGTIQVLHFNEDFDPYAAGWPGNGNPTYIGRSSTPLAPILQAVYPVVKAQLPSCKVGCASLLGKRTDAAHIKAWVSNLLSLWNGAVYCDFLDIHFYNCSAPPSQSNPNTNDPPLADRLNAMRDACIAYGHPNLDFWMTETGYQQGSSPPETCDVTTTQQSSYLQQTYAVAKLYGVTHVFVWTIGSKSNNSLVQGHGTNKVYLPAYGGMQSYAVANPGPYPLVHLAGPVGSIHGSSGMGSVHGTNGQAHVRGAR